MSSVKKFFIIIFSFILCLNGLYAQEENSVNPEKVEVVTHGGLSEVPEAKRPKKPDEEKIKAAASKDETEDVVENNKNTLLYGLPSEISTLLDDLISNEDPRFVDDIYDLFQVTENSTIKEKVLKYFTKLEDPCLEDFAVELLNDPYDEKKEVVSAAFKYIQTTHTTCAVPAVLTLIESENEDYFNDALATIGEIGGAEEAVYLSEYLDREDFSVAQRQTLMRTLGKMQAVETWDKIVEILEDDDENTFVRMYAAEAIGLMKKEESVKILVRNYSSTDPNFRQYVVKGLTNFPENETACNTIIQAVRDEHWKVRQEAIKACQSMELEDSMPFLIYRAKNDSEKLIKNNCIEVIAALNTKEGNEYLISQLEDKKVGDGTKQKIVEVLLKEKHVGEKEILALAEECVKDDKKKNLRYSIGKELAKNSKAEFKDICELYLSSSDATTISLGLDMYKNCKFKEVEPKMREIAANKKANNGVKNRIKKMLNIEDEEDSDKDKKNTSEKDSSQSVSEVKSQEKSE